MALQIINLGTLADGSDGDTNKVAWGKAKDNFAELYGRMVGKGYISGLQMKWVSATALTLTSGAAYIEGTGAVLFSDSDIAKTALSLSASTWYHVYVYDNAGTPDFILSTTAPAAAYNGTARSMTGDSSKRYVGSILTDASGAIIAFSHLGNYIGYLGNINTAPFLALLGGQSTARVTIDFSGAIPVTSTVANACSQNTDASVSAYLAPTSLASISATSYQMRIAPNALSVTPSVYTLASNQTLDYLYTSTPTGKLFLIVCGYWYER